MVELWRSWVISMVDATCLIVLFCFVALQENGTRIDLVFAVGRFCPEASAYEDFRSQSLRKWNQNREIRRNPSVSMQKHRNFPSSLSFSVHFVSFSPNFLSFRKANVRRLNWLRRCISLTLLQRTNVDVDLSCYVATKVSLMLEECHSVRESSCRTGKHRYRKPWVELLSWDEMFILETPNFQDLIDAAQKNSEIISFGERLREKETQ